MFSEKFIKSITLLSFFQLVLSKRSADRAFSYFYPENDDTRTNIDLGTAFALFRQPAKKKLLGEVKKNAKVFSPLMPVSPITPYAPTSFSFSTARNLFALHLNEGPKKNKNGDDGDDDDDDSLASKKNDIGGGLPAWAKAMMTNKNKPVAEEPTPEKSVTSTTANSFSLASLVNVEALLLASADVSIEKDVEVDGDETSAYLLRDALSRSTKNTDNSNADDTGAAKATIPSQLGKAQDELSFNKFVQALQQNVKEVVESPTYGSPSFELTMTTDQILKEATQKIETFVNDATATLSPDRVQFLLKAAVSRSLAVDQNADAFKSTIDSIVAAAEVMAREQGVDVSEAAAQARATTKYTAELIQVANGVLTCGYVLDDSDDNDNNSAAGQDLAKDLSITLDEATSKPLFHDFESVQRLNDADFESVLQKGSDMAQLSGAVYQDTVPNTHKLGHSIVANGTSSDVAWMVSDSIGYAHEFDSDVEASSQDPFLVRTITVRGYDASDETVDREKLLFGICDAQPVRINEEDPDSLLVHRGLLKVAKAVYADIINYIDFAGPMHKIVLNGHSIGGSVALLVLYLLVEDRGVDFVNEKVLRVFTYGSPPISLPSYDIEKIDVVGDDLHQCTVLESLGLSSDMVYGYVQPWDPIIRLFSRIDAMYPLIGDLGNDGITLYVNGPPRTLRPITRALLESWEKWPKFRDENRYVMDQNYVSVGRQHLLMPDAGRYLTDRLVSVNIAAFPVEDVLRVSNKELYSALETAFPLDVFQISLVPTAIRSFIHHFYPAYAAFGDYTEKRKELNDVNTSNSKENNYVQNNDSNDATVVPIVDSEIKIVEKKANAFDFAGQAAKFVLGDNF